MLQVDDRATAPVRLALWGAGKLYETWANTLLALQELGQVQLVALCDNTVLPVSQLDGMDVIVPAELDGRDVDYVVTFNVNHADEIFAQAQRECNVRREQLLTHEILQVPGLDFRVYHRLRQWQPSVISDGAWGRLACATLQMPQRSPFVGTRIKKEDYLRLVRDLPDYLAIDDLQVRGLRIDNLGRRYLSVMLGDVELRFAEAAGTADEVCGRWLSQRSQVDLARLFVQMGTADPKQAEQFVAMGHLAHKLCLVPFETQLPNTIQLPLFEGDVVFENVVESSATICRKSVALNLVKVLLGEGTETRMVLR